MFLQCTKCAKDSAKSVADIDPVFWPRCARRLPRNPVLKELEGEIEYGDDQCPCGLITACRPSNAHFAPARCSCSALNAQKTADIDPVFWPRCARRLPRNPVLKELEGEIEYGDSQHHLLAGSMPLRLDHSLQTIKCTFCACQMFLQCTKTPCSGRGARDVSRETQYSKSWRVRLSTEIVSSRFDST
jgi:hypothetical protein